MAEHKTRSPKSGQGTSQGRDQQQRSGGRGKQGGNDGNDRDEKKGAGRTGEQRREGGTRGGST